jgi:hypothetical protein
MRMAGRSPRLGRAVSRRSQRDPLSAFDPADREILRQAGLDSLDAVWRKIGEDFDRGVDLLPQSDQKHVRERLLKGLKASAREEWTQKGKPWPRRHGLDLLLAGVVVLFLCLGIRACRKMGAVGIAQRGIEAGEPLRAQDLYGADALTRPQGNGPGPVLRLLHDVAAGDYIWPRDLERLEVTAQRELQKGEVIPREAIRQQWKPYSKKPAATLEQVLGNLTTRTIPKGKTVRPGWIESGPVLIDQVVAGRRLQRFQPIAAGDVRLDRTLRQPGSLLRLQDAVGRYPLQDIEPGGVLTRKGLSPGTLKPEDLRDRQYLSIRVQPPSFRLIPQLPARVSLAVSASGPGAGSPTSLLLHDVPVLAVEPSREGPSVVAALTSKEILALVPLLREGEVYVLQPAS